MPSREALTRLDRLALHRHEWGSLGTRQRLNAMLDGHTLITIINTPEKGTHWQVEVPSEERVVQPWTEANSVPTAMRESTTFTRAFLLSLGEAQPMTH